MNIIDIISYSFNGIKEQKLRSWLTIIGIVLGVATVLSLVAIGDGVSEDINSQLDAFGANSLMILPFANTGYMGGFARGLPSSGKLYDKDFDAVMSLPGISDGTRVVYGRADVSYKDKTYSVLVYGAENKMFEFFEDMAGIETGRYYEDNEKSVAVLANDAANELFGKDKVSVGNRININGKDYRVVGILEKIGTSMSAGDDLAIYLPFREGRDALSDQILSNEISFIQLEVEEGLDVDEVSERVSQRLMTLHKVNEDTKDFSIMTADFVKDMVNQIVGALTLFLLLISSISAVVGGIGISNTMFMNVLNKTTEIGILKSIGAKRNDILLIFISQAAIIGLVGGIIGIGFGFIIVEIIKSYGIIPIISIRLILLVLGFAVFIGVIGGLIPAYNASKIPAIEALKY